MVSHMTLSEISSFLHAIMANYSACHRAQNVTNMQKYQRPISMPSSIVTIAYGLSVMNFPFILRDYNKSNIHKFTNPIHNL